LAKETARKLIFVAGIAVAFAPLAACGLSLSGSGTNGSKGGDAAVGGASADGAISGDEGGGGGEAGASDANANPPALDGSSDSSVPVADAGADGSHVCAPDDAGITGPLDLSTFVVVGSASFNENADGRITLTNSSSNQAGAAWYPHPMPAVGGYDLTWSLRVGPGNKQGDGITFALLASDAPAPAPAPALLGNDGEGLGLQGIAEPDGGAIPGYAVAVDMFQNSTDPTDLGPTTLKIITMPGFDVVAETLVPGALNDGNVYAVDVSWRAPSSLTATLHAPGGTLVNVSSSAPGLSWASGYLGFTGATGAGTDSHNEISGLTITSTCE
jgi:hypothetical protein